MVGGCKKNQKSAKSQKHQKFDKVQKVQFHQDQSFQFNWNGFSNF